MNIGLPRHFDEHVTGPRVAAEVVGGILEGKSDEEPIIRFLREKKNLRENSPWSSTLLVSNVRAAPCCSASSSICFIKSALMFATAPT